MAAGGGPDGTFGTDGGRVLEALQEAAGSAGAVVLMDLGSSVLSVRAALGELPADTVAQLRIADAPLVEGAIAAGVTASTGGSVDEVLAAAQEARTVAKF
jgi:PTS hybrid protein